MGSIVRTSGLLLPAALLLPALAAPAKLDAQLLEGRVLDGQSRQPLAEARLTLLHPDGSSLGSPAMTGADGRFRIRVPGPGSYFLRAERLSYRPVVDGVLEFTAAHGRLSVDVFLLPKPLEVEGVRVEVARARIRRHLRAVGFYERAASGFGHFIGPEEVERRSAQSVSDLIRRVPGVRSLRGIVLFTRREDRDLTDENGTPLHACEPNVWLNGVKMTRALPPPGSGPYQIRRADYGQGLDEYMNVRDVTAVEVYTRASSTPLQWGGLNGSCGTIVLWTEQGGR